MGISAMRLAMAAVVVAVAILAVGAVEDTQEIQSLIGRRAGGISIGGGFTVAAGSNTAGNDEALTEFVGDLGEDSVSGLDGAEEAGTADQKKHSEFNAGFAAGQSACKGGKKGGVTLKSLSKSLSKAKAAGAAGGAQCPPKSRVESWGKLSFDEFSKMVDVKDTFIHPAKSASAFSGGNEIAKFGISKDGCGMGMAIKDCAASNSHAYTEWKSPGTKALYKSFCDDCNSIAFDATDTATVSKNKGPHANQMGKLVLNKAFGNGCKSRMCQLQVCGKYKGKGPSPSYENLYFSSKPVELKHAASGLKAGKYSIQNLQFKVECGKMQKRSVCVPQRPTTYPTGKNCIIKKKCAGVQRVGIRKFYCIQGEEDSPNHCGYKKFDKYTDESKDVKAWIEAIKARDPKQFAKMVTLQCSLDCANH